MSASLTPIGSIARVTRPAPTVARTMRPAKEPLRVALAGCGTVGGELLRLLDRRPRGAGRDFEVVRVLVRDVTRERHIPPLPTGCLTASLADFLATDADVVIEAIGGLDPAARIATAALERGAHFITANKALVAARGGALAALARRRRATLRCDAAVGGGVPALRLIESALGGTQPRLVRGILNGTSNYVLTRIERGATLDDALADARARGFAEADASRDLDGRDAADKIALVVWKAFGISPERVRVRRRGIDESPELLTALATALGGTLRLVAECEVRGEREIVASVEPVIVARDGALGRTVHEQNHVEVHQGDWSAPLSASGPGAGGLPTATALLSDLVAPFTSPSPRPAAARSVDDERAFRWAIAIRGGCLTLPALSDADARVERVGCTDGIQWLTLAPTPWRTAERLVTRLSAHGSAAVVARVDESVVGAWGLA